MPDHYTWALCQQAAAAAANTAPLLISPAGHVNRADGMMRYLITRALPFSLILLGLRDEMAISPATATFARGLR